MPKQPNLWTTVSVDAPSRGLITRIPSDQVGKGPQSILDTGALRKGWVDLSNVRCDMGVLRNGPGYEACNISQELDSPPNLIFQASSVSQGAIDDTVYICTNGNIYAGVKQFALDEIADVIPPSVTEYCGLQDNWNVAPFGAPYSNSGASAMGIGNVIGGPITSDGTILSAPAGVYNLPVIAGNFTIQAEFRGADRQLVGFAFVDGASERALLFQISQYYNVVDPTIDNIPAQAGNQCNIAASMLFHVNSQTFLPYTFPLVNTWYSLKLQKSGGLFILSIDGSQYLTFESESINATGKVCLFVASAYSGQSDFRNIMVTI